MILSGGKETAAQIEELTEDLKKNKRAWENKDLESFLDALGAWVNDMDGYFKNKGEECPTKPDWKHFAMCLTAARIYE